MRRTLHYLTAAVCLLISMFAVGCAAKKTDTQNSVNTLKYNEVSYDSDFEGSGTVAENSLWKLNWDDDTKRVSFVEKKTGNIWSQLPREAMFTVYDENDMPVKYNPQMESAIYVYYLNPGNMTEEMALSAIDADMIYTQRIKNGLRVIYDFSAFEIAVPVEYTIEDGRFYITVHPEQIADNGERYATGVAVAPFLCGLKNGSTDSWLFLPDGSGAIIRPVDAATVGYMGMSRVYGNDLTVQSYYQTSMVEQIYMPVYGVKKGNSGLFAVINSGVEGASLAWNVGSTNIGYSSVYSVYYFRGYSLIKPPRGYSTPAALIKVFADYISTTPFQVAFYPLSGDDAGIMGMAETYRNYLIENKGLSVSEKQEKLTAIKYIGAVLIRDFVLGIPATKLYPLTTAAQAAQMTEEIAAGIGTDFYVDLVGFGKSGVDIGQYAGGFAVADTLGGKKGLRQLCSSFDKLGLDWFLDFDLIAYNKSSNGFSVGNIAAVWNNGQTAYFKDFDTVSRMPNNNRYYILARSQLKKASEKLVKKAKDMSLKGISLDSLSHTIYSDYSSWKTGVCSGIIEDVQAVFKTVKEGGYDVLAVSANDYAAISADAVLDAPLYSSGYDIESTDVPFYQLVFKGYIPMSSVSINLCADSRDALLRCVESGISPSFTLAYSYSNVLITSNHSFIFGCSYYGNKDRIIKEVNSLKNYLESVKGAKIADFSILSNTLRVTLYDNGVYAVVNYGDSAVSTPYGSVPARSWISGRENK